MDDYKLNTNWCLWYHSINDNSWTNNSYKLVYTIRNLYDIKLINDTILTHHLQNGMFFIMREGIFPTWEDPDNREGCCISFKVPGSTLKNQWDFILIRLVTEDLVKDQVNYSKINGLSISPKKEFNIVKIWLRENNENYTELIKEYPPFYIQSKSIHKKHTLTQ